MRRTGRWLLVLALLTGGLEPAGRVWGAVSSLEILERLKGMDLESNPALKQVVLRVLESTRGTPAFVELVRDFALAGQSDGLLEVAERVEEGDAGPTALRMLMDREGISFLETAVIRAEPRPREVLLQAVARTGDSRMQPLLASAAVDPRFTAAARSTAIRGLAQSESGSQRVLDLARGGQLDDAARMTAALALAQVPWPAVREAATKDLPLPVSGDGKPLPPISELIQLQGDSVRGARVFRSEKAGCTRCHRVGGEGVEFGPALDHIGSKLGRQGLYDAILDPSGGVAFGYEGWDFELRNGDEISGLLASETAEEVAVRQQSGIVRRLAKAEIARREMQRVSVMPSGLGQILGREELVDLVEYLSSLRPAHP